MGAKSGWLEDYFKSDFHSDFRSDFQSELQSDFSSNFQSDFPSDFQSESKSDFQRTFGEEDSLGGGKRKGRRGGEGRMILIASSDLEAGHKQSLSE